MTLKMTKCIPIFVLSLILVSTFLCTEAGRPTVIVVGKRKGGNSRQMSSGGMNNNANGYGSKYGEDGMKMGKDWNDVGMQYAKWPIGQAGGR